jgi:hypothetical protein
MASAIRWNWVWPVWVNRPALRATEGDWNSAIELYATQNLQARRWVHLAEAVE